MVNSYIAKKDLESEFSAVRNEFESGENSPFRVLLQRVASAAFEGHNYGKTTIGNRSDIENVPIENLKAFYQKYYQPDNAILTVSGKIDEGKTLAIIQEKFGKIPKPTRKLPVSYTVEPVQDGERFTEVRRTGDVQMVACAYHIMPGSHPDYPAMGDWRPAYLFRDQVRKVTADDVFRVAQQYLKPSNRTVGTFIPTDKPDRTEVPEAPDVMALVKDYKGEAAMAQGEAFDPSPENIESRTTRLEKPGTIEVALLPKQTRGNVVAARMTVRLGDEKSLMNKSTIASLTASMLDKGTKDKTRQQIKDELDRLNARVNFFGGNNQAGANVETTRENLPAVMKLIADVLKTPSFDATEFEKLKQEELAQIESQRSEPQAIAINEFRRVTSPYPKGDIRYVATFDEDVADLKAATIDQVKQFYKDFYGANNSSIAVVGDFDKDEIRKIIDKQFGTWKSAKPFTRIASPYQAVVAQNKSFETPDKANSMFVAGLNMPLQDSDADYPALVMADFMLGGGFINSRLATRIRQKDGLSYGVGSQFSASSLDKNGSFLAYAIYAPQNAEKLEQAFKEEIEKAVQEGFTADELKAAKSGYLQERQVSRAQDAELAGTLNNNLYLNRTMDWDADFEKKIEALTPAAVKAAAAKYIDYNKFTVIKAGDFEKVRKDMPKKDAAPATMGGSPKK